METLSIVEKQSHVVQQHQGQYALLVPLRCEKGLDISVNSKSNFYANDHSQVNEAIGNSTIDHESISPCLSKPNSEVERDEEKKSDFRFKLQYLKSRNSFLREIIRRKNLKIIKNRNTINCLRSRIQSTEARMKNQQNAHRRYRTDVLLQLHQINQLVIHHNDNERRQLGHHEDWKNQMFGRV